jgi:hypothetical protein
MSLRYKFSKARSLLKALSADERAKLRQICEDIRLSQEILLKNALPAMQQCLHNCEGLCCRNAQVDDIIGLMDLVYILTLTPELEETMTLRVVNEKPFYSADCMFLKGDSGPCIFASAVRPEVCITTFCSGDRDIQKEIRAIKRQFFRLNCFFWGRKPRAVSKALKSMFKAGGNQSRDPLVDDQPHRRINIQRKAPNAKND